MPFQLAYEAAVYRGGSDLLLGGVTCHRSAPFAVERDAATWAHTVLTTNRDAGRDAAYAIVRPVRVKSSTVIPEARS